MQLIQKYGLQEKLLYSRLVSLGHSDSVGVKVILLNVPKVSVDFNNCCKNEFEHNIVKLCI